MTFVSVRLTSLSLIISKSIHVAASGVVSFIFTVEQHSIAYM